MSCKRNGRTQRVAACVAILVLTGICAIPAAAQDSNRVERGAAAEIGQPVPGRSGRQALAKAADVGRHPVEHSKEARIRRMQHELRLEKMKKQAVELAEMAKALQEELEKTNPNILSVGISKKARKIQKLAGKIRNEARF